MLAKYDSLMTSSTLLKPLTADVLSRLLREGSARITEYNAKTVVHFEGELCSCLDIVLKGRIALERIDASGNVLTVGEFGEDNILGGNLMFSKSPIYALTAITRESTVLMTIDKEAIFAILSKNADFLLTYLEFVSDNATILGEKIKHEIKKPIRDCIIDFLKKESIRQQSKQIRLTVSKKALAERIGVQRTSLSRELARMRKNGMIMFDSKSITVLGSEIQ
jgi:CRP-like cAMP-binding protein